MLILDGPYTFGMVNTSGKTYIMAYSYEHFTLILGYIRHQDAATKCHRRDDFQMGCSVDSDCPPCNVMQLLVEGLDALHVLAVLVEFIVGMLPHRSTDESARVNVIRSRDFGHFHEANLDRNIFKNRRGNFFS